MRGAWNAFRAGGVRARMRFAHALLAALLALVLASPARAQRASVQPERPPAADARGKVTIPLSRWQAMQDALRAAERPRGEGGALWIDRRLEGRFHQGLWSGRLVGRLEVRPGSAARVPVLDGRAIVGRATLDGDPAALLEEGGMYTAGVDTPGRHEIAVDFHWGRVSQRFTRTLRLKLPEGGPVALKARVAERDIEASLARGALTAASEEGGDTVLAGQLDGAGELDLSWKRRAPDEAAAQGAAKLRARQHTLFTISEGMVAGRSAISVQVDEGEIDAVTLDLPRGVEVVRVEGDAVLQWRTALSAASTNERDERGELVVLLRHLVHDATEIRVDFQLPAEPGAPLALSMPAPSAPTTGSLGVVGPPGLSVEAKQVEDAEPLAPRDLPAELSALTESPVLFGFRFERAPRVVIAAARLAELPLASTLVDELQASTVLLEDGTERTKLKLRIRNSTRQYVEVALPEGARLTHSFIDGRKVRPAIKGGALLFPLRQSERLAADKDRIHVVRPGETLSDVANLYYSDPSAWMRILNKNREVVSPSGALTRGAELKIPPKTDEAGREASFIIELSYEQRAGALGLFGQRALRLPSLDVDTMKAVWHVYSPSSHEPLAFRGNLTQTSGIKYDLFRRIQGYLGQAMEVRSAHAGGYESILQKRRAIYDNEAEAQGDDGAALTTFPLVGEQTRFRRILLGREAPELRVVYASASALGAARHAALVAVFGVTLWALLRRHRARWLAGGGVLLVLLVAAHYIPGMHRRILWGVDLALLVALARRHGPWLLRAARIVLRAPWRAARALTARRLIAAAGLAWLLGVIASYPLLLSAAALACMSLAWWSASLRSSLRRSSHAH